MSDTTDKTLSFTSPSVAVIVAIIFALSLVLLKTLAFLQTGSVAMLSSLVDSLLDSLASAVNLLAIRYALLPPDQDHRFGHGKAEPLAALAQAAFITGSGGFVLLEALRRVQGEPAAIAQPGIGVAVMGFAIVGTAALVVYQRHVARKTGSLVIEADSVHYFSDLLSHAAVMAALLLSSQAKWWWVDPLIACLIAAYVLHSAWTVGLKALNQLMDRELSDELREQLLNIALAHPEVVGAHDLKTRAAGPHRFIQLHLEMDAKLNLEAAHSVADDVEQAFAKICPGAEILIHQDPVHISEPCDELHESDKV